MKELKYKLIASDFDGTLLRSDYTVAEETVSAISKYVEAGGIFSIITGRGIFSILPIAKKLGLKGIVSGMQGHMIADIETGKLLVDGGMEKGDVITVLKKLEEMDAHTHLYDENTFYVNKIDEFTAHYETATGTKGVYVNQPLSVLVENDIIKAKKVFVMLMPENRQKVYDKIKEILPSGLEVVCSGPYSVEVISTVYSKGTALEYFSKYYGVPLENILCVGDALNDLPMLRIAGKGLAVKNCDEELGKVVEVYPYSNNENAVGRIIEEYGYRKE